LKHLSVKRPDMSVFNARQWKDPEQRPKKIQACIKGGSVKNKHTAKGIQRIRNANIGKAVSPETREKISKSKKEMWAKNREKLLAIRQTEDYKTAWREGMEAYHKKGVRYETH
jgi:hypothetical protein